MSMKDNEALQLFREAKVAFSSYYKFSFSFRGKYKEYDIYCSIGGSSDDIYKYDVEANKEYPLVTVDYKGDLRFGDSEHYWSFIEITKGKEVVFQYDDGW